MRKNQTRNTKMTAKHNQPRAENPVAPIALYLPGLEAAIGPAVELMLKGGEKAVELVKSEGPLRVQVLDSHIDGGEYEVKFRATNLTEHGVYLDSMTLSRPIEQKVQILRIPFAIEMPIDRRPPTAYEIPSQLIAPSGFLEFRIRFTVNEKDLPKRLLDNKKKRFGVGELAFWVLCDKEPQAKEVQFAIRLPELTFAP